MFFGHFGLRVEDPSFELLRGIVSCFSRIPYENLTKIIKKFTVEDPVKRMRRPEEVIGGYMQRGTGGTCFSLTFCLGSILNGTGYRCHPVMADMKRPNNHCALLVHLGARRFIADPGYLLGEPVELADNPVNIATPFGRVELRPRSGLRYDLYTITGGERKWRYRLKTEPVPRAVFLRHWQDSFSLPPMNSLQLTKLTDNGHLYIRDHHLRFQGGGGKTNENIRSGLESRIELEFGIPDVLTAEAREYLERMKRSWRIQKQEDREKRIR